MNETIKDIREIDFEEKEEGRWQHYYSGYKVTTDRQEILLLIGSEQDCCEIWGFLWCNENPQEFVGHTLWHMTLTDKSLNTTLLPEVITGEDKDEWDDKTAETIFVNLETSIGPLQFVAYNAQNGYYGHKVIIRSKQFKHEQVI